MQLKDFFDYKNKLMEDLLTHQTIVSLIKDDLDVSESKSLAYTQVFPYEYVPKTVQDGGTYVCFEVEVQNVPGKTYLVPVLYIWIFSHRSNLRLPDGGGIRVDNLCSEVCQVINGSFEYGLGPLELIGCKRFAPMTDYQGRVMTFTTKEFNRPYNGKKYIPGNRKAA